MLCYSIVSVRGSTSTITEAPIFKALARGMLRVECMQIDELKMKSVADSEFRVPEFILNEYGGWLALKVDLLGEPGRSIRIINPIDCEPSPDRTWRRGQLKFWNLDSSDEFHRYFCPRIALTE